MDQRRVQLQAQQVAIEAASDVVEAEIVDE